MPRVYLAWLTLPSDDAWNQLKNIAQLSPDNPWVHYGMGRIYTKWKMVDQARAEVNPVLKRDPKFYPALTVLGDLLAFKENWADAEATYRQVLQLADDPVARSGLGLALLKQHKKDEALTELKQSTVAFPEQPLALATLLPLLLEAHDPAALGSARSLAELRPKDREARRTIAELAFAAGDKAAAAKEYEKVLQLGAPDASTLNRLGGLYRELFEREKEEKVMKSLALLEPANADPQLRLAQLRLEQKDQAGADAALVEAVTRDPTRVDALLMLAKSKVSQGVLFEALERYRAAKEAAPTNDEALAGVAKLEGDFKLRKAPIKGNVNGTYYAVTASLEKFFAERKAANPALAGKLRVRVKINKSGTTDGVEVIEDTLKDPLLLGHVYFSLKDAEYSEKKKLEPVIDFELGALKQKGK
jgi:tetratricopeptide (TPR) repeat protein